MFDINTMISVQIDPCSLAAIGGMLLSECEDQELASEFAAQTVVQMMNEGCDPDEVMSADIDALAPITFQVPAGIVMAVAGVMTEIAEGPHARSVALVMKAWQPAMLEIVALLKSDGGHSAPFDEFGNCMN